MGNVPNRQQSQDPCKACDTYPLAYSGLHQSSYSSWSFGVQQIFPKVSFTHIHQNLIDQTYESHSTAIHSCIICVMIALVLLWLTLRLS